LVFLHPWSVRNRVLIEAAARSRDKYTRCLEMVFESNR
jgi:hypothetical protein